MSKTVEEIHQIALKFEQGILKLHYDLKNDIIDGIQHGHRLGVLFEEHQEAINQLLIEAEKRGVAWTIGIIDEMHEMDIEKNGGVRDSQYKGIKNGIRAMYEQDTGNGDPAPNYPINVELQSTLKNATEKEQ